MKKLILSTLILFSISGFSQITIDMDDIPQPGQEYARSTGTSSSMDVSITGPNMTWDYSDLQRNSNDTLIYNTVSQTPIFYQFQFNNPLNPNYLATEAKLTDDIDLAGFITMTNNYLFSKTEISSWSEVGIGTTISGAPLPTKYNDTKIKLYLPITYGDQNTDTYDYEMIIPALGTLGQEGTLTYEVDGWGILITPGGTFQTLRVKTTTVKSDTIFINLASFGLRIPSTEVTYEWYASNEGFPVLTVTEQLGIITSVVYIDDPLLSVNVVEKNLINTVYPNPTDRYLNIDVNKSVKALSIWNSSGSMVLPNIELNAPQIEVSKLSPGIYFVKAESETGVEWMRFIKN